MKLEIIISGNPATKKNSPQIISNPATGRPRIIPSKTFTAYQAAAGWQIPPEARNRKIATPVNLRCLYYMQTRRKVDLNNLLEATTDILVKYGVLEDDNSGIVAAHDGSRVYYDKNNPRAEITITDLEE